MSNQAMSDSKATSQDEVGPPPPPQGQGQATEPPTWSEISRNIRLGIPNFLISVIILAIFAVLLQLVTARIIDILDGWGYLNLISREASCRPEPTKLPAAAIESFREGCQALQGRSHKAFTDDDGGHKLRDLFDRACKVITGVDI